MRILNHMVEALVLAMIDTGQAAAFCRWVTAQLVGDQYAGHLLAADQQFTEEADCSLLITARVYHHLKDRAVLVDGALPILRFAVELDENLVHRPSVSWSGTMSAVLAGIGMTKLQTPIADRFLADDDPTFGQDRFHIAVTQVEIEVKPDGMGDDFSWKPMSFVGGLMMCIRHRDSIDRTQ